MSRFVSDTVNILKSSPELNNASLELLRFGLFQVP